MNLLFISIDGKSLGLVERVRKEGHVASLYLVNPEARKIGEGIVDKTDFTSSIVNNSRNPVQSNVNLLLQKTNPDLIVFDGVGVGKVADSIRSIPVFGGCRWADLAETDPSYAQELMKSAGIQSTDKHVNGVEVSCELWWNGMEASSYNITLTANKFMNEDIGPDIGGAGSVVRTVLSTSKIVMEGIGKMVRLLKKTSYRGPISLQSIASKDALHGVSFTVGFNYTTLPSLIEIYKGSITKLLYGIATGSKDFGEFTSDYGIAVHLSVPPYPTPFGVIEGVPVFGVNASNAKHIWWGDAKKNGSGYESAGLSGSLLHVVARGRGVDECRRRVYRTISNLTVPQVQYRTDIGLRVNKSEKQLTTWGYF